MHGQVTKPAYFHGGGCVIGLCSLFMCLCPHILTHHKLSRRHIISIVTASLNNQFKNNLNIIFSSCASSSIWPFYGRFFQSKSCIHVLFFYTCSAAYFNHFYLWYEFNSQHFMSSERFIIISTRTRHWSLSWIRRIQPTAFHPVYLRSILISSSHQRLGLPSYILVYLTMHSLDKIKPT
jgi:hypothetical protein